MESKTKTTRQFKYHLSRKPLTDSCFIQHQPFNIQDLNATRPPALYFNPNQRRKATLNVVRKRLLTDIRTDLRTGSFWRSKQTYSLNIPNILYAHNKTDEVSLVIEQSHHQRAAVSMLLFGGSSSLVKP